ncbi:hypothetical protein G3578_05370 [Brevibacillus sp. SYP-B805]|uniref:hypothetical protein n=1 Tax=Brevibacillus sp. SYP-B805 TaxID=1578199 RepID=UPI0013EBAF77|nr:hypothetical protein [Brevibacillus sp. SYP-B805]NGQ94609.1 hypothetical protein [Brevibacillus sp. SYP-B805]
MFLFWRDLVMGVMAWLCAEIALDFFPQDLFGGNRATDLLAMLMFKPVHLSVSLLAFLSACYLLHGLLKEHGRQFLRPSLPAAERLIHAVLFGFALFLLIIQTVKLAVPTALAAVILLLAKIKDFLRNRALLQEMESYRRRKK